MTERERALLDSVKRMEDEAPSVGLCSYPFKILREEIEKLIEERDAYEELYIAASQKNRA